MKNVIFIVEVELLFIAMQDEYEELLEKSLFTD